MKDVDQPTMRIAHVVRSDAFAGVERYIANVAPLLAAAGHSVTVIGGDPQRMEQALADHAIRFLPAASTLRVARQVRGAGPFDVVHAHMTAAEMAVSVATLSTRARLVTTRHFAAARGHATWRRHTMRPIVSRFTAQIAISDYVAGHIGERSIVVLNGVPRVELSPGSERVVLVAQRLEAEKETPLALRAWHQSGIGEEGWRLVVAGGGSRAQELAAQCRELGITASVDWVGHVSTLDGLMNRSRLFLATAPREPFGLSVVEAMAAGLPVIAAGAGGHLETIGMATPETLFSPGDAEACAKLLRWLAHDDEARQERSVLVRQHQQTHLSIDDHVKRLIRVYEQVLS